MTIIIWVLLLIVFAVVCAAIGFYARELIWNKYFSGVSSQNVKSLSSGDAEMAELREQLAGVVPQANRTESLLLENDAIQLPAEDAGNDADLQIVEGIGPKIEAMLKMNGITSRSKLASSSIDELRRILATAGATYQMHDPSTWSYQARLAVEGRWAELNEYQDFLLGGRQA